MCIRDRYGSERGPSSHSETHKNAERGVMYEVRPDILEVAKALGEETRFNIFRRIADAAEPLSVKDLVAELGMHHSAIRIHLGKLEDAGLIYSKKRHIPGTCLLYTSPSPRDRTRPRMP